MVQEDEVGPKKKKSKIKWIVLLLLLLILGGGGFFAYKTGMLGNFIPLLASEQAQTEDATAASGQPGGTSGKSALGNAQPVNSLTKTLPDFLVNLSDPLGRRYIKLTIDVEMSSSGVGAEVDAQSPRIRDALIMLLSSKTYNDLATNEGKILLKNEILDRINQIMGQGKITGVYFTNLVIQ